MKIKIAFDLLLIGTVLLICGCGLESSESDGKTKEAKTPTEVTAPKINADSAFAFVVTQIAFGPRNPGSRGHAFCKEWLAQRLGEYADTLILQNFTAKMPSGKTQTGTNIMGMFNPKASERILLAAHWDTRAIAEEDPEPGLRNKPIMGADDGASGVAVLLEVARQLSIAPLNIGVDIVFFDLEDQGISGSGDIESWCLGSQYWSRNLPVKPYNPRFGILLDMVGSKSPRFTKEAISMNFAPDVMNRVWQIAAGMGYGGFFVQDKTGPITDDHYFVNTLAKIPMINIINRPANSKTGFGDYWHTHADNLDIIEPRSLQIVGNVLMSVLYKVDQGTF